MKVANVHCKHQHEVREHKEKHVENRHVILPHSRFRRSFAQRVRINGRVNPAVKAFVYAPPEQRGGGRDCLRVDHSSKVRRRIRCEDRRRIDPDCWIKRRFSTAAPAPRAVSQRGVTRVRARDGDHRRVAAPGVSKVIASLRGGVGDVLQREGEGDRTVRNAVQYERGCADKIRVHAPGEHR